MNTNNTAPAGGAGAGRVIGEITTTVPRPADIAPCDSDPRLAEAIWQTSQGRPVFVLSRSKRPLLNCPPCRDTDAEHRAACTCLTCHSFHAATTDPGRVAAMLTAHPRGLLALRTGAASEVVVIDVDPRNGGMIDPEIMAPTFGAATGGGGWHLWYRHPGGYVPSRELERERFPGVDVKADGGYIVLPPSVHPKTGMPYRWLPARPLVDMPRPLLELVTAPSAASAPVIPLPRSTVREPGHAAGKITNPERLLAAILDKVRAAPEGRRRPTLYGGARGVAKLVQADALTLTEAWNVLTIAANTASRAGKHPMTAREIRTAIIGGFTAEGLRP